MSEEKIIKDSIGQLLSEAEITRVGNPSKPQGEEGRHMLSRMNRSHGPLTRWALTHLDIGDDDHILDIGCGGGATLARLSSQVHTGHLTGIDYSEVSVEMSRETNKADINSGKMDICQGSVEDMPFDDKTFDKIITVESFYFWPEPAKNLNEVYRVLKQGGQFLLVADIYDKDDLSQETRDMTLEYGLFNPGAEEFRQMFERVGFTAVEVHTCEGEDWICVEGTR